MTPQSRLTLRWPVVIIAMIVLVSLGAGGAYLWMRGAGRGGREQDVPRRGGAPSAPAVPSGPDTAHATPNKAIESAPEFVVTLSDEAIKRAGIEMTSATTGAASSVLRIPGTVEPNAYKQVTVTPLVAGRITRVLVELGDRVRRSQTLAEVFSPELADAQTKYLSTKAELEAHERELDRTTKLVEIGAASRQELEQLHAEHAAKVANVQSLRSRLVLLGMPAPAIDALSPGKDVQATTNIPAPIAGVVTERAANIGLNIDMTTKLFTVVDLSSVWVVGALYERDFPRVHVGTTATVITTAYPDLASHGRVSYIDPQVSAETRTARVRVEVPNPGQALRLGMFAEMQIAGAGSAQAVFIPRSAIQNVGERQVVYVASASAPGRFAEREVRIGDSSGDQVEVLAGVQPGDRIVSKGSFFVRAERERLGLGSATSGGMTAPPSSTPSHEAAVQTARITVGEQGFDPARVTLHAGVPARLTFMRTTDKTCATAVVFSSLNIRRELPLNQPIEVTITPARAGEIQFACGMNMLRGTVVVH